jgi:hypothetical protein
MSNIWHDGYLFQGGKFIVNLIKCYSKLNFNILTKFHPHQSFSILCRPQMMHLHDLSNFINNEILFD